MFAQQRADMERTHRSDVLDMVARQQHILADSQREIGMYVDTMIRNRRNQQEKHISFSERLFNWWFRG